MAGKVVKAVAGVTGVVMLSRGLGMIREMVIADRFGTSSQYDLYLIAIMIPALAYGVLNFAFYYLLVPYLTRRLSEEGEDSSGPIPAGVWSVFNGTMVAALAVAALIFALAPVVMKIWSGQQSAEQFALIIWYARLMAAIVVFGTLEAFLRAMLNSMKQFTYPAGGWIVYNLFSVAALVFFSEEIGVTALALAMIGGLLVQNLYLMARVVTTRRKKNYTFGFDRSELSAVWGTAGIIVLIEILGRSYFMIDRFFGLPLGEGVVAALTYSQVLVQLPDSIVGFAIGTVLFPLLSQRNSSVDEAGFYRLYTKGISAGFMLSLPVALFVFLNAQYIVQLIFMRGSFDSYSLGLTALSLKMQSPAIVALFIMSTSLRACYARNLGKMVLVAAAVMLVIKFVLTWFLSEMIGYSGITLATAVAQIGFAVILVIIVRRSSEERSSQGIGVYMMKIILIALVAFGITIGADNLMAVYITDDGMLSTIIRLAISATIFFGSYLGLVKMMRLTTFIPNRIKSEQL